MNDNTIAHIEKNGFCHFRDINSEIAIQFVFLQLPDYASGEAKRINLKVTPFKDLLEGTHTDLISDKVTIIANCEEFESAIIYTISVDTTKRIVSFKMTEEPVSELWKKVITLEEINGVNFHY